MRALFLAGACIAGSLMPFAAIAAEPGAQAAAYWDPSDLAASRRALQKEHGGQTGYYILADRFEYRSNEGSPVLLFDGQGWWGADRNKLWIKSEIERNFAEGRFEEAELQALWSRAISGFFDFQAGVRHDFQGGAERTFGVLGVQGLAPYWFEVDAALFVSGQGDVSARIEAEYDLLITQKLIVQPRTELDFAAQSVRDVGVGSGLSTAAVGVRLRYEVHRQFAPYIGVEWSRAVGKTADFARAAGEDAGGVSFVAGVRLWF